MKKRPFFIIFLLALAVIPIVWLSLCSGASGFGFPDISTENGKAILMLRKHRIAAGFMVGASLSCAGAVFQALLRNPLAEPYVLGISSGAGLGAAIAILFGLAAINVFALPITAFVSAGITLALVFRLASDNGELPSIYSLILSGVIVSSVCSSMLMFLVAIAPVEGLHSVVWWMLGNLQPADYSLLSITSLFMLAGMFILWAMGAELNAMTLGSETAHYLGIRTKLVLISALATATLITASAVGLAGLIGFVGLIVPHAARQFAGPDHKKLLPFSALLGGIFLVLCDIFSRTILSPREVPVGVITAIFGGPFFLILLKIRRKRGWME